MFLFMGSFAVCRPVWAESNIDGIVLSLDTSSKAIVLNALPKQVFTIGSTVPQDQLATLSVGDKIKATISEDNTTITSITKDQINITVRRRLSSIGLALFILGCATWILTDGKPKALIIGLDNRYSNSKTQLAIWSAVLATSYLSTLFLRITSTSGLDNFQYIGGIDIPENLATLSGLSALSFGGAKAITTQKAAAAAASNQAGQAPMVPQKTKLPDKNSANLLRDLFQDDNGNVDLGDFQMIFIATLAAIIYCVRVFVWQGHLELSSIVTLPDIDTTLLAGFGIGQGAYIIKKMASDPGDG